MLLKIIKDILIAAQVSKQCVSVQSSSSVCVLSCEHIHLTNFNYKLHLCQYSKVILVSLSVETLHVLNMDGRSLLSGLIAVCELFKQGFFPLINRNSGNSHFTTAGTQVTD